MRSTRLFLVALLTVSCTVLAHAAGSIPFLTATDYSVGLSPMALATGDFNHDGKIDLVVTPNEQRYLNVLLGNGDGTFQPAVNYITAGRQPYAVAVGDFNGDGNLDLAVAVNGGLAFMAGNGDGTFQQATFTQQPQGNYLAAADVNKDGKLDLVVLDGVQLGNGDGTFQPAISANVFYAHWQAIGDFNGDGKLDLAISLQTQPGEVDIVLGQGNGSFNGAATYTLPGCEGPVATGDFNGDGKLDLLVALPTDCSNAIPGSVTIMLGNGDGTFQSPVLMSNVTGLDSYALVTGDFSGDHKIDVAVVNSYSNDISELLGNGDGSFEQTTNWAIGVSPIAMVTADVNGDGLTDIVVVETNSSKITVLLSRRGGGFNAAREFGAGSNPRFVNTGDFNEDGIPDLVTGTFKGVTVVPGNGDGTFAQSLNHTVGTYGTSQNVVVDLNHDGHLDVVAVQPNTNIEADGKLAVLLGNGDGTLQNAVSYPLGDDPTAVTAGDFNGDGNPDIAVANDGYSVPGSISLFLGKGDGTLQSPATLLAGSSVPWCFAGDFNGDGKLDLAVITGGSSGGAFTLLGNGDGTFQPPTATLILSGIDAVVADFNHDGKLDLAVIDYAHTITIALGNGDGTFSLGQAYQVGSGPTDIRTADFDGDGILDLAVNAVDSSHESKLSILKGNGDGTFQQPTTIHVEASSLAPGDFNRDGKMDLAVVGEGTGKATILLNAKH